MREGKGGGIERKGVKREGGRDRREEARRKKGANLGEEEAEKLVDFLSPIFLSEST